MSIFTQTEIDIAKQLLKIAASIMGVFILYIAVISFVDTFKNYSGNENEVEGQTTKEVTTTKVIEPVVTVKAEVPLSLSIPAYNISTVIEAPNSTNTKILDAALMRAAVYYPGSGYPGAYNTLIFGHSTSFKVVRNKAYQVFNNIKTIVPGTLIYVKTQSGTHIYKTRSVQKVSKYTSWIQFKSEKPMLTLATCDSFGKASDRWVLEADYVGLQ